MARAGWSFGKFSASKLNHSASSSGPCATSQPIATKTSSIRAITVEIGMPGAGRVPVVGQGDVDGFLGQHPGVPLGDQDRPRGRAMARVDLARA